jgi:hypothetical protein
MDVKLPCVIRFKHPFRDLWTKSTYTDRTAADDHTPYILLTFSNKDFTVLAPEGRVLYGFFYGDVDMFLMSYAEEWKR